ncbi:hypothetical protein D9M68_771220 [compost metagenome]
MLDEGDAGLVQLEDVGQAFLVEGQPALGVIAPVLFGLDGEAVGREGAQEDAVEAQAQVLVDDGLDLVEALVGGGHQRRDTVIAEHRAGALESGLEALVAVPSRSGSIGVVQVTRPVQRGGQVDVVHLAEHEHVVIEQG